jgi:hypothetical protein
MSIKATVRSNRERVRRNVQAWRARNPDLNRERQQGYNEKYYLLSLIPDKLRRYYTFTGDSENLVEWIDELPNEQPNTNDDDLWLPEI